MLNIQQKTTNINGEVLINDTQVIQLFANINHNDGNHSITANFLNTELYKQNKQVCDNDIDEFYSYVEDFVVETEEANENN